MNIKEAAEWIGCDPQYFLRNWHRWGVRQPFSKYDPQMLIWKGIWDDWLKYRIQQLEKRRAA